MQGAEPLHPSVHAFVHELRRRGYVEGENLVLERRSAEGVVERINGILEELLRLKMDVIVAAGNDGAPAGKGNDEHGADRHGE